MPRSLVSVLVSFAAVQACPQGTGLGRVASSQTVLGCREHPPPADLESVLGATPQEFESLILRHAELRKCGLGHGTANNHTLAESQFLVNRGGAEAVAHA